MEEKGTARNQPPLNLSHPTKIYVIRLEGHSLHCIKALAPYDTEMPKLMCAKISDANVRSDIVATPAVKAYLIKHFTIENEKKLYHLHRKSIARVLKFLYTLT